MGFSVWFLVVRFFRINRLISVLVISSLTCLMILGVHYNARAQVAVSPLVIQVEAKRGQAQGFITVANRTDKAFRARVYTQPFTYDQDKGFMILDSSSNDLSPYLQFSPRELIVPPQTARKVRLIARFPPSLAVGEYRAIIFTENLVENNRDKSPNSSGQLNLNVVSRVGTAFYVSNGSLNPELNVVGANWHSQRQKIMLLVKNSGQATARPRILYSIKQGTQEVVTGTILESSVIAGSQRNLTVDLPPNKSLSAGEYEITGQLMWGKKEGMFENQKFYKVNFVVPAANKK